MNRDGNGRLGQVVGNWLLYRRNSDKRFSAGVLPIDFGAGARLSDSSLHARWMASLWIYDKTNDSAVMVSTVAHCGRSRCVRRKREIQKRKIYRMRVRE